MLKKGGGAHPDYKRKMDSRKIPVILTTDWRLDVVQGRTFGVCFVEAPPEHKECSFKRGFPLPNPTHSRCAVFAVMLGLEQLLCSPTLNSGGFVTAVVTKSEVAGDVLVGKRSDATRKWASDPRSKPLKVAGYGKQFLRDVFATIDDVKRLGIGEVVYVPEEKDERGRSLMDSHTTHLDIDPDTDYEWADKSFDEQRMIDIRQRHLLCDELLRSAAMGSRRTPVMSKKQREKIAREEGHKKKKEAPDPQKVSNGGGRAARPTEEGHSGLAAAIAAEERRRGGSLGGAEDEPRADAAVVVQDAESRIDGRDRAPGEGAGADEAAAADGTGAVQ